MIAAPRPGLTAAEGRRRLLHMSPGVLPVALWFVPHADPISPTLRLIAFGVLGVVGVGALVRWKDVSRERESSDEAGAAVLGYVVPVAAMLVLLPGHAECAFAVLGVLAFGDGSATLVGKTCGGPRLPWNGEKSVAGFAAFVAVGTPLTALLYWGETTNPESLAPPVSAGVAWAVAASSVGPAAVAESVRSGWNDNVRVGLTASASVTVAHFAWAA